ncbi:MAG TPA: trypsin-like peptidase domain-containing protein [Fimbriiglobus sp.]|nr:trypsin-like peptidase domain-containing protein [Fimbriiglobus sp.]
MRRGLLGLLLTAATAVAAPPPEGVRAAEDHLRKVIAAAEPSVVAIVVSHSSQYPPLPADNRKVPGRLGGYEPPDAVRIAGWRRLAEKPDPLDLSDPHNARDYLFGSGVVLDADGLVLTTYNLIEGATKVYVRAASGQGYYADIHAADARSDLAVLKPADGLPRGAVLAPIKFADVRTRGEKPTVAKGMWVVALGHPAAAGIADGSASASWGILSNVGRRAAGPGREDQRNRALHHYNMLLQTDARVTLGCSGGALLNLDGELIGMTTPMAAVTGSETAGGFAIPFDRNYRRIVEVLRAGREVEYGFLGVQATRDPRISTDGLVLAQVVPGTPAEAANLTHGDVLTAIDGVPVGDMDDLFLHIGAALAGTKLKLTVYRNRQRRQVEVTLAKLDHPLPRIASSRPDPVHGLRVDYSSVLLVQKQNAPRGAVAPRIPPGVVVRELVPGSPAEAKFKTIDEAANQWLITRVNGKPVPTPADFYREAARSPTGSVSLTLVNPDDPSQEKTLRLP